MILPHGKVTEAQVARHYDELDHFYLDVWGEHVHHGLWASGSESCETAVRQLVDLVAAEAEIDSDSHVCDVGAGYGAAARQMAVDYGARVTALTLSRSQHDYARTHFPPNEKLTYILGDWLNNPFSDEQFDAVIAIESASHMCDLRRFVREASRVLKPGGRFVICAWVAREAASDREVRHLLEPICREGRLAHLSTAREYVGIMEEAGLVLRYFLDLSSKVDRTWGHAIRKSLAQTARHPEYARFLVSPGSNGRYLLAMVRMWLAYRVGAIRYCLFKAYRPAEPVKLA